MNELFAKEGSSIFTFKPGDIIIRVRPRVVTETIYNENLGVAVTIEKEVDNSYRHAPYEFLAIENNLIYIRTVGTDFRGSRHVFKPLLDLYADGWALHVVPDGLTLEDCI